MTPFGGIAASLTQKKQVRLTPQGRAEIDSKPGMPGALGDVLRCIKAKNQCTPQYIAEETGWPRSNVDSIIKYLAGAGQNHCVEWV